MLGKGGKKNFSVFQLQYRKLLKYSKSFGIKQKSNNNTKTTIIRTSGALSLSLSLVQSFTFSIRKYIEFKINFRMCYIHVLGSFKRWQFKFFDTKNRIMYRLFVLKLSHSGGLKVEVWKVDDDCLHTWESFIENIFSSDILTIFFFAYPISRSLSALFSRYIVFRLITAYIYIYI